MKAFKNTEVTKPELLASLARHRAADRLMQGIYWENGKGCAVGCSIHDFRPGSESRHSLYPELFGIHEELAHLEDTIFENLPVASVTKWPERFVNAIQPGADLSRVLDEFMLWLFSDSSSPLVPWRKQSELAAVEQLYTRRLEGDEPGDGEWEAASASAGAAPWAAPGAAPWAAAWEAMADKLIEIIAAENATN